MTWDKARCTNIAKHVNAILVVAIGAWVFVLPGIQVARFLRDPAVSTDGTPVAAWSLFRSLSPRYEQWARRRLASTRATELSLDDISGTEWPLFGSVFYLWAVESLQDAWEEDSSLARVSPAEYARGSIEAATELVLDPGHAAWVVKHWGEDYLHRENVFYRALTIAAMTSHCNLTGDKRYLPMLRERVEALVKELDASPYGVLDDYPGECYPADVLTAIGCIRRADAVLDTDHSAFITRAARGFEGNLLDKRGLVPYAADSRLGLAYEPSRGCGNAYVLLTARELWPEKADHWYELYEEYFWQEKHGFAGFREFPNDLGGGEWYWDVDAGPVMDGFGVSASAFGAAASRIEGRFDHAYPLSATTIAFSWPLPNGVWLIPRALSNAADAPYLGEACILYNLTRRVHPGVATVSRGRTPLLVRVAVTLYFALGILYILRSLWELRRWRRKRSGRYTPLPVLQLGLWSGLVLAGAASIFARPVVGILLLLFAQLVPKTRKKR